MVSPLQELHDWTLQAALALLHWVAGAGAPLLHTPQESGLSLHPAHMGGLAAGVLLLMHVVPRFASGRREGKGGHEDRGTGNAPPEVALRPTTAHRIATTRYQETRWHTRALDGPGLLSMCVGPAAAGKSELLLGMVRAGYDGEAFGGVLETTRPKRVLLLSEMGGETLAPALRRWGFYTTPVGRWRRLRLRLVESPLPFLRVWGPGGLLDVVYSTDIYRPVVVDGELRQAQWPMVIEAIRTQVERGRYDRVIVDSLGEWLGSDHNDALLKTLAACRQLTAAGAGVTLLHHTPRADARRPRGGSVIEAKLDIGYSVTGLGSGGMPRSREDPARQVEWFKTRFPAETPPGPLLLHRHWPPGGRPTYRPGSTPATPSVSRALRALPPPAAIVAPRPDPPGVPGQTGLTGRQRDILAALQASPDGLATTPQLAAAVGLPGDRVAEVLRVLVRQGLVTPAGLGAAHQRGSKRPRRWAAVVRTGTRFEANPEDNGSAERLLREALGPGEGSPDA